MKVHDKIKQQTPEWYELHRGRPTAGGFDKLMTPEGAEPRYTCRAWNLGKTLGGCEGNADVPTDETCGIRHTSAGPADKCSIARNKKRKEGTEPYWIVEKCPLELAAAHNDFINELIASTLYPGPMEDLMAAGFQSAAMDRGAKTEAEARDYYAMEHLPAGLDLTEVGFCETDDGRFGCSPDGLIVMDITLPSAMSTAALQAAATTERKLLGGLELKCPTPKVHVGYLRNGGLPAEYRAQVHGELVVTGLPWIDFMSYCIGFPPLLVRVERNGFTAALEECLERFWALYQSALEKVRAL